MEKTSLLSDTITQASLDLISLLPGVDASALEGSLITTYLPFVLIGLAFSFGGVIAALISLKNQPAKFGDQDALTDLVVRGKQKVLNPLRHVVFEDGPKDPRAIARSSLHQGLEIPLERQEPLDLEALRKAKSKFGQFGRNRNSKKAA